MYIRIFLLKCFIFFIFMCRFICSFQCEVLSFCIFVSSSTEQMFGSVEKICQVAVAGGGSGVFLFPNNNNNNNTKHCERLEMARKYGCVGKTNTHFEIAFVETFGSTTSMENAYFSSFFSSLSLFPFKAVAFRSLLYALYGRHLPRTPSIFSRFIFCTSMFLLCLANLFSFASHIFAFLSTYIFLFYTFFSFAPPFSSYFLCICVLNTIMLMHFSFNFVPCLRLLLFFHSQRFFFLRVLLFFLFKFFFLLTCLKRAFLYFMCGFHP